MKLSKQRKRYFTHKILELTFEFLQHLSTSPEKGREQFLRRVYEAKLTVDPEALFYVGGLTERVYHGVLANEDDRAWLGRL
jgi:hypothetical protein